ncbi:MAG: TrmH family methyltransferase [Bacteroidetes bacterium]|nr:TrmH family methyltransferase [Bacteroidota bacterium]
MKHNEKIELINYLTGFISENRKERFDEVIANRTDYLTIVLEDLYQAHNASAVLRSCDCFGIQNVHFIENKNNYKISADVAMGSSKWLTINRHNHPVNNTKETLLQLKSQGYKIVATTPHKDDYTIDTLPINQKIALVFGTEIDGISQDVYEVADEFVKIPMYGFTESFNISVCAALCMYELSTRIRKEIKNHLLTEYEKTDVYLQWLKTSIDNSKGLIENYYKAK